jgi:hypothetical protein
MGEGESPTKVVTLDTDFVKSMQKQADSIATRASAIVIDEQRGVGFELSPESRESAVTLFMTLRALSIIIDWVFESQPELEEAMEEQIEEPETGTCLIPAEAFMKIVECTRISTDAQDRLEYNGISLILH